MCDCCLYLVTDILLGHGNYSETGPVFSTANSSLKSAYLSSLTFFLGNIGDRAAGAIFMAKQLCVNTTLSAYEHRCLGVLRSGQALRCVIYSIYCTKFFDLQPDLDDHIQLTSHTTLRLT